MRTLHRRVPIECIEHEVFVNHNCEDDNHPPLKADYAIDAFREIIHWIYQHKKGGFINVSTANAKIIAFAMLIDPSLVGVQNIKEIQRVTRGRIKRRWVGKLMKQFQAQFNFKSSVGIVRHD